MQRRRFIRGTPATRASFLAVAWAAWLLGCESQGIPSQDHVKPDAGDRQDATNPPDARDTTTWRSTVQAWIYPGPPACNAPAEYADGRVIHVLKPEYFTVAPEGTLRMILEETDGCNGFSEKNAADVRAHSRIQLVTVSAGAEAMAALVGHAPRRQEAVSTLVSFVKRVQFSGVELDFEGFGKWTRNDYAGYLRFVEELGNALHQEEQFLAVDGPAIESASAQGNFQWRYEDFEALPVDQVIVMAYDYQYDYAAGSPVAPTEWVVQAVQWVKARISDSTRIAVGIPAYGYHGRPGQDLQIDTHFQSSRYPGYERAIRDARSFEMYWENDGQSYFYVDSEGLNRKREAIEAQGITTVSAWHLGGNQWFSGKREP
ncbi:MAG: hypothetical protein HY698_01440 [Deltaproteobacteria bacterium]|nr:hypothetical protein [Deltaproteobacteria bacterium]